MPLFYVQDSDRPAYVVATTYSEAIGKWQHAVTLENGEHAGNPDGVSLMCGDNELIVEQGGNGYDDLLKQAKDLCLRIDSEGGHGYVVHDMAKRVLGIIGDRSER